MADTVVCPNTECPDVELFGVRGEYRPGTKRCPKCGARLVPSDEAVDPPGPSLDEEDQSPEELVAVCSPQSSAELAVVKSLLDAEGIYYYVHNEYFGSLQVGPSIPLLNARTVLVPRSEVERVRDLLQPVEPLRPEDRERPFSTGDKLRMFLEVSAFWWLIPIRRFRRSGSSRHLKNRDYPCSSSTSSS